MKKKELKEMIKDLQEANEQFKDCLVLRNKQIRKLEENIDNARKALSGHVQGFGGVVYGSNENQEVKGSDLIAILKRNKTQ